jgi:MoaA/NifB/PqqE/SkfB family radical SAM enzyme
MKLIGRDLDLELAYSRLRKRPLASCIQGAQKLRQITGLDRRLARDGWSLCPLIVTYEVTHRCNLRCRTCWLWGPQGKCSQGYESGEITLAESLRFIDSISAFRPYLLLTGGEPLLHEKIADIVGHASSKGLFVGLITNGMLAECGRLEAVVRAGLDFLTVSIDSSDRDVHNLIRGNPRSYDNCVLTLELIKRLKRGRSPLVTINVTVSDYNYEDLAGMLAIAEDGGADVLQFQHQWFCDDAAAKAYGAWAVETLGMRSAHMEAFETNSTQRVDGSLVHRQLKQLKSDSRVQVRVVPDLAEEDTVTYYAGMSPVDGDRCTTPWCGAIVKPNGDVVPCIDYVVGNVTETPFRQIWNSERMRLFRKVVREQRYFPGCTRCCGFFG